MRKKLIRGLSLSLAGGLCLTALLLAVPADTPVVDAAKTGNVEQMRSLLKQGVDVNAAEGDGMTALHWAAFRDDPDIAEILLYAGANVGARTRVNAITPLILAARNGSASMVEMMLDAGADANAAMTTGTTPLMSAATSGNADAVEILLDHEADIGAKETAQGQTALMLAASYDRSAAIKVLMDHGADPTVTTKVVDLTRRGRGRGGQQQAQGRGRGRGNAQAAGGRGRGGAGGPVPLLSASGIPIRNGNEGSVTRSQGNGRRRGGNRAGRSLTTLGGLTPLLFAVRQGNTESVRVLLEEGADIHGLSAGDKTAPLLMAVINGHFDLAMFLIEQGADATLASTAGATPLYVTVNVKWGPESGYPQPDTTQNNTTYLELMQTLIDKGADVNARLKQELWFTAYTFDLSRVTAAGATPFWRAAQVVDIEAMRLLIANGADLEINNSEGVSPLHVATGGGVHGNDEVIAPTGWLAGATYLVDELGADVNARDDAGYTPLHSAASIGEAELVQYLVDKGGNVRAISDRGETTADMANGPRQRIQPYPELVALLRSLGSKFNDACVSC